MSTTRRLRLELTSLEIAKGHDGFLRGKPEPVVIVAVYLHDGAALQVVARQLYRFRPTLPFPSSVAPTRRQPIEARIAHLRPICLVVLAVALEEDGDADVRTFFGAVERHEQLSIWPASSATPSPLRLAELTTEAQSWRYPTRCELLVDGIEASSLCTSDEWIGSVAWLLPAHSSSRPASFRLPFVAVDERNDWTALVEVQQ